MVYAKNIDGDNMDFWNFKELPRFEKLNQDICCDVLVIGGGIAGLLVSYYLTLSGVNAVVLEKNKICLESTAKTTAFLSPLEDFSYQDMIKDIGLNKARQYYNVLIEAIDEYRRLNEKINIDFNEIPFIKSSENRVWYIEEVKALKSLEVDFKCYQEDKHYIIEVKGATINPYLLVKNIIDILTIYENSPVLKVKKNTAILEGCQVKANKIIVCTNYPIFRLKGLFGFKIHQNRSYESVRAGLDEPFASIKEKMGDSYALHNKEFTLFGGNDRRVGCIVENHIDNNSYSWANQDSVTADSLPYIGRLKHSSYYVSTGFCLYGITKAMISAQLLTDLIVERKSNNEKLFSIYRKMKLRRILTQSRILINDLVTKKLHCTHLYAGLRYNKREECYECKCHGSRFDKDGNVINGPATKNIKIK